MDPKTGRIVHVENDETARRLGLIPIPADELPAVRAMNRKQRRAWARNQQRRNP
jgi:hypothetical protein